MHIITHNIYNKVVQTKKKNMKLYLFLCYKKDIVSYENMAHFPLLAAVM